MQADYQKNGEKKWSFSCKELDNAAKTKRKVGLRASELTHAADACIVSLGVP